MREFLARGSDIDTVARENIAADIAFILSTYGYDLDIEEAIAPLGPGDRQAEYAVGAGNDGQLEICSSWQTRRSAAGGGQLLGVGPDPG